MFPLDSRTGNSILGFMTNTPKTLDIAHAARTMDRKSFIAAWLVRMTATKANRTLVNGLHVKRSGRSGYAVAMNGTTFATAKDTDSLYEYARRSALGYFVREAEELRIAVLGA